MCAFSMIADHGTDWLKQWPQQFPDYQDKQRIAELERRVADLEDLLKKAKKYDEETGQPDCELDEKKALLRKLAGELGVSINIP